jgi:hypothetical protein
MNHGGKPFPIWLLRISVGRKLGDHWQRTATSGNLAAYYSICKDMRLVKQFQTTLKRITNSNIKNQIFFSPRATSKINIIQNPSLSLRQIGLSQRKCQIGSQD